MFLTPLLIHRKLPVTARTAGSCIPGGDRLRPPPFILLSFSSSKKARKAQETQSYQCFQCIGHTGFNTSGTNGPHSLSRMKSGTHATPAPNRAHSGLHGETRGVLDGGWYHYPRSVPHVHEHPRAGCQNGVFCRFWALTGCAHKEHREPSGQRCAYARRCPEASLPRWAA